MDRISLILQSPDEPDQRLDFLTAPSEASQAEPHLLTLERLPHRGTYRESHGAGIASLMLRGTFGYKMAGDTTDGFAQFKALRQFYRDYMELMGAKDPALSRGTRLQYHNHTEGEHWYAEIGEFRTPRGPENRVHYIYELDLKLVGPAYRAKFKTSKPDKKAVIRQTKVLIDIQMREVRALPVVIKDSIDKKDSILSQLETKILRPLSQLQADIKAVVSGARDAILFPIRKAKELVDNIQQALEDIGSLATTAITAGAQALHGLRKSVIALLSTPQAFKDSLFAAGEELIDALSVWQNVLSDAGLAAEAASPQAQIARTVGGASRSARGARRVETRANDTLPKIAARELGDAGRWHEIALLNGLTDTPYLDANGGAGKLAWGKPLLIPSNRTQEGQGVVGALEGGILIHQQDTEARIYGRDIKLFERDGRLDIRFAPDGQLATTAGRTNLLQAVTLKTRTYQQQLLEEPSYGMRRLAGRRMGADDLDLARWATEETCLTDPRIEAVEVELDAKGNLIKGSLAVTPIAASGTLTPGAVATRT